MNEAEFLIFKNRADDIRASIEDTARNNVIIFLNTIAENLELSAIYTVLGRDGLPDFSEWREKSQSSRRLHFPDEYIEKVRVCLAFLEAVKDGAIEPSTYAVNFSSSLNLDILTYYITILYKPRTFTQLFSLIFDFHHNICRLENIRLPLSICFRQY